MRAPAIGGERMFEGQLARVAVSKPNFTSA